MFPNLLYSICNISEYIRHVCKTILELQGPVYQTKEIFHSVQCNLLILKHVCVCVCSRLKLGNVCYYSAQNLLSSRLLSKNLKIKIYRTIILPVVLYGCETWLLTLMEEHRLRVFENLVLRRVFGPKRDEVTEEWRKLHNEEFRDLYSLPNIVRVVKSRIMRWAWHVARMGKGRGVHRVLVGKPEGKRPLGRPRRRWVDNIRMDLREVGRGGDWMELAQDRDR